MFSYILVGGQFSDEGGKPSGYIKKLFGAIQPLCQGKIINGGTYSEIQTLIDNLEFFEVIFWMPDISNDKEKLVKKIKEKYPKAILIISKNNLDSRYPLLEIVARALSVKANLFVEFVNPYDNLREIQAGVYDPLGNCFCKSKNINEVAAALISRVFELLKFTRVPSIRNDNWKISLPSAPEEFFAYVRNHAETFHKLIHAQGTSRLLGNASFRCENGFPSFRSGDAIFMSRRNIDKRAIDLDGFVQTRLVSYNKLWVDYVGEHKPSVDAPVQLLLYRYYPKINFILHSHTYIWGGNPTDKAIPCGAVEEFFEIIKKVPGQYEDKIFINLKGHGSLAMVSDVKHLKDIPYRPRPFPEDMGV